jgi:hypothetical protein
MMSYARLSTRNLGFFAQATQITHNTPSFHVFLYALPEEGRAHAPLRFRLHEQYAGFHERALHRLNNQ